MSCMWHGHWGIGHMPHRECAHIPMAVFPLRMQEPPGMTPPDNDTTTWPPHHHTMTMQPPWEHNRMMWWHYHETIMTQRGYHNGMQPEQDMTQWYDNDATMIPPHNDVTITQWCDYNRTMRQQHDDDTMMTMIGETLPHLLSLPICICSFYLVTYSNY